MLKYVGILNLHAQRRELREPRMTKLEERERRTDERGSGERERSRSENGNNAQAATATADEPRSACLPACQHRKVDSPGSEQSVSQRTCWIHTYAKTPETVCVGCQPAARASAPRTMIVSIRCTNKRGPVPPSFRTVSRWFYYSTAGLKFFLII